MSFGNSFYTGAVPSSLTRREDLNPVAALDHAVTLFALPIEGQATAEPTEGADDFVLTGTSGAQSDPKARLVYFVTSENTLVLTWRLETDVLSDWLLTYVDAESNGAVLGVVNYVAEAGFQVYPWGFNDPRDGARQNITDPWDKTASEFGWFGTGTTSYTTTRGNNAIAQENRDGDSAFLNNYRPTSANLIFSYPYSLTSTDFAGYQDASITQLFYTANVCLSPLLLSSAGNNQQTDFSLLWEPYRSTMTSSTLSASQRPRATLRSTTTARAARATTPSFSTPRTDPARTTPSSPPPSTASSPACRCSCGREPHPAATALSMPASSSTSTPTACPTA